MLVQVLIMEIQSTGSKLNPVPVLLQSLMVYIIATEVSFNLKSLQKLFQNL
jgi:hypothetical protein